MTQSWLDPVRAALDASDSRCPVFFRDDDAGWDDARLTALLDVVAAKGVRIDVAVIPAALTASLRASLLARTAAGSIRLHQHGYAHVNHEPAGRKHEFGPSRDSYAQQSDIAHGQLALHEAFGEAVDKVFTPPWNRCTSDTGDVLVAQGFEVLSRDQTAPKLNRPDLVEVPVTIDWFGHTKGVRWTRPELGQRLAQGVVAGDPVGVMLHHAVSDAADLAAIGDLVDLIAGHPAAQPTTIIELATLTPATL